MSITSYYDWLTPRERQIVDALVADCASRKEIAARLFISEHMLRNYATTIYQKLGVKNRTELCIWYYRQREMSREVDALRERVSTIVRGGGET